MNFLLRRQLHVISIKFSQILTVHPPLWLMKWRGFDTSLWEPLWFTNCTSCSQRLRTGSTPWAWLCFLSSVSHSQGTSAEQPMDHQTQLATGQKSNKQVLADNRSLLYFGLPQAVTFQKSSSAVCQRMQYASIHSTRDQDGREGKQQPLCERCSGLQGHFCPCFWRLSRNCGIDERVCSLERFVKVLSSEPFPTVCFHRKQLGKTSWERTWSRASRARQGWGGSAHGLPTVTENEQWRRSTCCCDEDLGAQLGCTSALHISASAGAATEDSCGQGQHLRSSQACFMEQQCLMGSPLLSCQAPLPDGTVSTLKHRSGGGDESVCEHVTDQQ